MIRELEEADEIVIGAPMYNFTISPSLKAWIDQIARIGKTFSDGADGLRGLLAGKRIVVVTGRGGAYRKGTSTEKFDFQEPYLRHILGFIGFTDVTFIHAEEQGKADPSLLAKVEEQIGRIAAAA